ARRHKITAVIGMSIGLITFWVTAKPDLLLLLPVAAILLACAAFVWSRPEPTRRP
ncbi:MAG: hypothetical protein JWQ22_2047, partial [Devosia sp.]|nr:hypothetical protein [Devosia sp.]